MEPRRSWTAMRPPAFEPAPRFAADGLLHERRPAERRTFRTDRHPAPPPEAERIDVGRDPAVAKRELRLDDVVHRTAGDRERVARLPVRGAGRVVGANVAPFEREIAGALAQ